jgi:hypothetical protein
MATQRVPYQFPGWFQIWGLLATAGAAVIVIRLIWEQTILSWERGPQMVGYSLLHIYGLLIFPILIGFLIWLPCAILMVGWQLVRRKKIGPGSASIAVIAALVAGIAQPSYGFWQRLFINHIRPSAAVDFITYAAADGDVKTVKAYLDDGVDINAQSRSGTALHGAAVAGQLDVIQYLIDRGADVNAINAYGDSPLANAMEARSHAKEAQSLLVSRGALLVRGSDEHRKQAIHDQMEKDLAEMKISRPAN